MFRLGAIVNEVSRDTERALSILEQWKVRDVEIHTAWGKSVELLSAQELQRLVDSLKSRQMKTCCVSSTVFLRCHLDDREEPIEWDSGFVSIEGNYQAHLDALECCFGIAEKFQAPMIRIFGFWRTGPTTDDVFQQAVERIGRAAVLAERAGFPLVLENCPHTYFDWGSRAAQLLEMLDTKWVRSLWDPANSIRADDPDYLSGYRLLRNRMMHVHAKDIRKDPSLPSGRAYVPVGRGLVDWKGILTQLSHDGYDGIVSLETHHVADDGSLETAARESFAGLASILEEMAL
jgi:sugar phosphate isomerase/epimerase